MHTLTTRNPPNVYVDVEDGRDVRREAKGASFWPRVVSSCWGIADIASVYSVQVEPVEMSYGLPDARHY